MEGHQEEDLVEVLEFEKLLARGFGDSAGKEVVGD